MFEGVRGSGYQGDISLDDIKLTPGACAGLASCDFESDLCGWNQRQDDKFDWIRRSGHTPSLLTGPGVDHTIGSSSGEVKIKAFKSFTVLNLFAVENRLRDFYLFINLACQFLQVSICTLNPVHHESKVTMRSFLPRSFLWPHTASDSGITCMDPMWAVLTSPKSCLVPLPTKISFGA